MPVLKLLKIDPTRVYSAKQWAEKERKSEATVYRGIADKSLNLVEVAGTLYIYDVKQGA